MAETSDNDGLDYCFNAINIREKIIKKSKLIIRKYIENDLYKYIEKEWVDGFGIFLPGNYDEKSSNKEFNKLVCHLPNEYMYKIFINEFCKINGEGYNNYLKNMYSYSTDKVHGEYLIYNYNTSTEIKVLRKTIFRSQILFYEWNGKNYLTKNILLKELSNKNKSTANKSVFNLLKENKPTEYSIWEENILKKNKPTKEKSILKNDKNFSNVTRIIRDFIINKLSKYIDDEVNNNYATKLKIEFDLYGDDRKEVCSLDFDKYYELFRNLEMHHLFLLNHLLIDHLIGHLNQPEHNQICLL